MTKEEIILHASKHASTLEQINAYWGSVGLHYMSIKDMVMAKRVVKMVKATAKLIAELKEVGKLEQE